MSVSVIIPTLNEEGNIFRIHKKIIQIFENLKIDFEIIFVDDKSDDNTQKNINTLVSKKISLVISPTRKGLGNAISLGWKAAKLDYVLFLDCDSHVSNSDLIKIIKARSKKHMVIGSRYLNNSKINGASKFKMFFSKILNFIISKKFKLNAIDISHSLRILPNKYFDNIIVLTHPGYFWCLSKLAKSYNLILKEVPITFNERNIGISKNTTLKMIVSVIVTFYKVKKM